MQQDISWEEKRYLLKMTLMNHGLALSSEQEWDALLDHIEVHKYLVSEHSATPMQWWEAVFSWIEDVYEPLQAAVEDTALKKSFPGMSRGSLLFALSTHWYFLKEKNPAVSVEEAALDYAKRFSGAEQSS